MSNFVEFTAFGNGKNITVNIDLVNCIRECRENHEGCTVLRCGLVLVHVKESYKLVLDMIK